MNKNIRKQIEKMERVTNFLKEIGDLKGIAHAGAGGIFFLSARYSENLKKIEEIEKRTGRTLKLENYYRYWDQLALSYSEEATGIGFVFYCVNMEETLEALGCELIEETRTITETEVVCSTR